MENHLDIHIQCHECQFLGTPAFVKEDKQDVPICPHCLGISYTVFEPVVIPISTKLHDKSN